MNGRTDSGRIHKPLLHGAVGGLCLLALMGCEYIGDPWTNNDPQWKHDHFATHSPDAVLQQRAWRIQGDR